MANMFDVSTTMSDTVTDSSEELQQLSNNIASVDEKVDDLKVSVQNSMTSVDDSLDRIVAVTNNIVSKSQQTLQEQQTQIQLMETELEVQQMKGERPGDSEEEDLSQDLQQLRDAIELISFDVDKILQEQKTANKGSNFSPPIMAGGRGKLAMALSAIFGVSVLSYLFSDAFNDESSGSTAEEAKPDKGPEGSTPKTEEGDVKPSSLEEKPADSGSVNAQSVKVEDSLEQKAKSITPTNDMADSVDVKKIEPGKNADLSIPELSAMPPPETESKKTLNIEAGDLPGINGVVSFDPYTPSDAMEQKPVNGGDDMMEAVSMTERNDEQRRINLAQNIITVVNQNDSAEVVQQVRTKPLAIIGKVTFDQIMRG
jgi:hypothetical protein